MIFGGFLLHAPRAHAQNGAATVIKFATLAPEGSAWMKAMAGFNEELREKTGGKVRFKFYPGGVSGDEKDVVRKIRLGQLQAAGLTGVGLGEIAPELRILDAPFLFRDETEADAALKAYGGELSAILESRGLALLGWTEVGFVYLFTNTPVRAPADLRDVKMWVWEGDPIAQAAFSAFGVHPIPLSITDVMTSLQTGLINGVYSSPMAAIALQWFTKTKHVSSVALAYAAGAVVVSKKTTEKLSAQERKILMELGRRHMARLTELGRRENRQALATLRKEGLTQTEPPTAEELKAYEAIGAKARRSLAGRLYSEKLLDRVERFLAQSRQKASGGKKQK
ncbi:MAG: TRAP transporter substrate-binding protein DctP [Elusimicrobia bacterium]|nr:TRAP transporter substrate-binding protein DctP [Elusimicrobiota bacterium]